MIICESCEKKIPPLERIMDIYMVGYTPRVCEKCFENPDMETLKAKQKVQRSLDFREWLGVSA